MSENAIELKGICKYFGKVTANDNISLTVKKGEILSLLGERIVTSSPSTRICPLSGKDRKSVV